MTDKNKRLTSNKLIARAGGFALSLPIALGLASVLLMLNVLMTVIIVGGLMGLNSVITPYLSILSIVLVLGLATMFVLLRSVLRYVGNMNNLWARLRGIQDEQARIDRLMDKEHIDHHVIDHIENDSKEQKH